MKCDGCHGGGCRTLVQRVCRLDELGVGRQGRVMGVSGPPDLRRRLLEMGFCNAVRVEVVRRAPLGNPIEFYLRGYHLSLRSEQAQCVQVRPEEQTDGCSTVR